MAWDELKQDVYHLADPSHRDEWLTIMESEFSERTESEIETLKAFAELLRQRTDYHADWLASCRPEIPEETPPASS